MRRHADDHVIAAMVIRPNWCDEAGVNMVDIGICSMQTH